MFSVMLNLDVAVKPRLDSLMLAATRMSGQCFDRVIRLSFVSAILAAGIGTAHAQGQPDYEQPPVSYSSTAPRDAIARIQKRIESGELAFAGSEQRVLQTLLD